MKFPIFKKSKLEVELFEKKIHKLLKGETLIWFPVGENYLKVSSDSTIESVLADVEVLLQEMYMLGIKTDFAKLGKELCISNEISEKVKEMDFYKNIVENEKKNLNTSLSDKASFMARYYYVRNEMKKRLLFLKMPKTSDCHFTLEERKRICKEMTNTIGYFNDGVVVRQTMYTYTREDLTLKSDYELARIYSNHLLDMII